jgi:GR25 family glycosyltransferase involved in LPS biosynthesis
MLILLFIILVLLYLFTYKQKNIYCESYVIEEDLSYVICLDEERFNVAYKNLSKYFPNLKKYEAIVIENINEYDQKLLSISGLRSIFYDENRNTHADLGSLGAVGCALSHYNLWQKVEKGKGMYIFESDAVCIDNPIKYVNNLNNFHVLLFGSFEKVDTAEKRNIIKVNNRFYGMHGYYITYEGAQLLSKYMFPIEQQIDSYISDLILLQGKLNIKLNIYIVNPSICFQKNDFGTSIQTKTLKL